MFTTLVLAGFGKVPDDRVIDGVDMGDFGRSFLLIRAATGV
jgi:hypothetical protein